MATKLTQPTETSSAGGPRLNVRLNELLEDAPFHRLAAFHSLPGVRVDGRRTALLRADFAHKVVYYAAQKGFWVYVPTNARLLRPDVTDRLADAGVATFNFAVDVVDEKPGLPTALAPIRRYFEYLVRKQYRYGYTVFFNINICRTKMDDVRQLTEIAHEYGVATDYHRLRRCCFCAL